MVISVLSTIQPIWATVRKNELKVNQQAAGGNSALCLLARNILPAPAHYRHTSQNEGLPHPIPQVVGARDMLRIKEVTSN